VTIIVSIISDFGLIQASDSNLTASGFSTASPGTKVFPLGFNAGALALAGTYSVGTGAQTMETWMPSCISDYASTDSSPTQAGFANYLKDRLNTDFTPSQRAGPTIIQIVGYVSDDAGVHPTLHVVRNDTAINTTTGAYQGIQPTFQVSEDFWNRDYKIRGSLGPGEYQTYFNGTPDGRIAYFEFMQRFQDFLLNVWSQPNWKFRPPQSLDELASIVELQIRTIGLLYGMSNYAAPSIGGDTQIIKIAPPPGVVSLATGTAP
jgi:hypothetical protein